MGAIDLVPVSESVQVFESAVKAATVNNGRIHVNWAHFPSKTSRLLFGPAIP